MFATFMTKEKLEYPIIVLLIFALIIFVDATLSNAILSCLIIYIYKELAKLRSKVEKSQDSGNNLH
jgi:hypothetical protein